MLSFAVAPEIFQGRPDYVVGVLVARRVDNGPHRAERARAILQRSEAIARQRGGSQAGVELWHAALARFGVDPQQHPPAVERLLDRVRSGQAIAPVNPAV